MLKGYWLLGRYNKAFEEAQLCVDSVAVQAASYTVGRANRAMSDSFQEQNKIIQTQTLLVEYESERPKKDLILIHSEHLTLLISDFLRMRRGVRYLEESTVVHCTKMVTINYKIATCTAMYICIAVFGEESGAVAFFGEESGAVAFQSAFHSLPSSMHGRKQFSAVVATFAAGAVLHTQ